MSETTCLKNVGKDTFLLTDFKNSLFGCAMEKKNLTLK